MLLDRADAEPLLGIGAEDGLAVGARAARSPRLALGAPLAPLRGWRCALGGGAAAAAGLRGSLLRSDDVLTDDEDAALLGGADAQAPLPRARRREPSPEHAAAADDPFAAARQAVQAAASSRRPPPPAVLGPPAQARMEGGPPGGRAEERRSGLAPKGTRGACGCNCCVCVPQDEFVAEQNFGRFLQVLRPGFHFLGVDVCGCCIQLETLSRRVHQSTIVTRTITKDRAAVELRTAVQQAVSEDGVFEAFYRLSDIERQVSAYVADVVLSSVPRLTLEELFVEFDSIGRQIRKHLRESMSPYGIRIVQVLVLEARLDEQVKGAFGELVVQRNLRGASMAEAEAEAIRVVKGAEADAEKRALEGRGMALKREALAQGIVRSVFGDAGLDASSLANIASSTLVELLYTLEYFDALRHIGSRAAHTVFLHQGPSAAPPAPSELRSPRDARMGSKETANSGATSRTVSSIRSIASSYGRRRPSLSSVGSIRSGASRRTPQRQSNMDRGWSAIVEEAESER